MIPVTELVRDRNAWSRAASRSPEATFLAATRSAAQQECLWPLFHRGTSDNWCTMSFATCLRSTTPHDVSERWLPDGRAWDSSKAVCKTGEDLLVSLLKRRLCRRGQLYMSQGLDDDDGVVCANQAGHRASKVIKSDLISDPHFARRPQVDAELAQCVDELLLEELLARRQIALGQRQARKELSVTMLRGRLHLVAVAESRHRSSICSSWLTEYRWLESNWRQSVRYITGMRLSLYRAYCVLCAHEQSHRVLLLGAEERERATLRRLAYIGQLHSIEVELARCRRTEKLLRRSSNRNKSD